MQKIVKCSVSKTIEQNLESNSPHRKTPPTSLYIGLFEGIKYASLSMSETEKRKIAQRLYVRIETGLHFIEFEYLDRHKSPDLAWIRNIYILLSFYTELLLKLIIVLIKDFSDTDDLDKTLRKFGHNLECLANEIGINELSTLGIRSVIYKNANYTFKMVGGTFSVEDFTDIRYDFIDGKVRTIYGDEHNMFRVQIACLRSVIAILKPKIW